MCNPERLSVASRQPHVPTRTAVCAANASAIIDALYWVSSGPLGPTSFLELPGGQGAGISQLEGTLVWPYCFPRRSGLAGTSVLHLGFLVWTGNWRAMLLSLPVCLVFSVQVVADDVARKKYLGILRNIFGSSAYQAVKLLAMFLQAEDTKRSAR